MAGIIFLVSNLVMQSGWARERVAGILERRTRVDWEIGSLSWTPWSGVRLGEVRARVAAAEGADPLCAIGSIRVIPDWGQLVRGKRAWREIVVRDPDVSLPVELLTAIVAPAGRAGGVPLVASGPDEAGEPGPGEPPAPK
ncbi:MAG: hypothetical protein HKN82_02745, partial [Akkermansiaceae bacterium]|nr:hypothetical protein [Akkermansiaceae bacterium]